MLGDTPADIFLHRKSFAAQSERDAVREHGLEVGDDIVFNVKRPRRADAPSYEAANTSCISDTTVDEDRRNQGLHDTSTDPQYVPRSSGSASTVREGNVPSHGSLHRRIADIHNSWFRGAAADLDDDMTTSGTLFMGSIYIFPLEQNK